jgi:V8-like Glu-specific endopeptidase
VEEVGAVLAPTAFPDGTWAGCTGTLISPTVFLTAEHCDQGLATVDVTFDTSYDRATGTTYTGTWHGDPNYRKANSDPHDLAVIVSAEPVLGIKPAGLPTLGQLASLAHGAGITSVGYGAQGVEKAHGKGATPTTTRMSVTRPSARSTHSRRRGSARR